MCSLWIFLHLVAYFSAAMSAAALLVMTKIGAMNRLLYHVSDYAIMCASMASKGEPF